MGIKLAVVAVGLTLSAFSGLVQAQWQLDRKASTINFVSTQMGVPVKGHFDKFDLQLDFDNKKPEAGKVVLKVDVASIDAGSDEANEEVVGEKWLNADAYALASFRSTKITRLANGKLRVDGALQIRDKTEPLVLEASIKTLAQATEFSGEFVIMRSKFGVGSGVWADPETVANEIKVNFVMRATNK